jgi:hypothetical protein
MSAASAMVSSTSTTAFRPDVLHFVGGGGRVRGNFRRPARVLTSMTLIARRFVVVLCASATLVALPAWRAGAATVPTQAFTGGGSGDIPFLPDQTALAGNYSSTGQLGGGRFSIQIGSSFPGNPAWFKRSDGMILSGTAHLSNECGTIPTIAICVRADLSGTADIAHADVVMSIETPAFDQYFTWFLMRGTLTLNPRIGYAMVSTNGTTYAFGGMSHLGDAPTTHVVDLERTPSGAGYWIVNDAGQVYAFGDARYLGGAGMDRFLSGRRVTSMSATPSGKGYWLFTSDGRALEFGDAARFGDLSSTPLNQPVVGSVATPTGKGYYMVARDGGVFAFGDAKFRGSMGGTHLNQPVVGIVPTADNAGYWLVASDGGVFSFNAPFHGSMGAVALNRPVVSMVPYDGAYLMVASDGGLFNFSNSPFFGSAGGTPIPAPIVSGTAAG